MMHGTSMEYGYKQTPPHAGFVFQLNQQDPNFGPAYSQLPIQYVFEPQNSTAVQIRDREAKESDKYITRSLKAGTDLRISTQLAATAAPFLARKTPDMGHRD
uniref:Uncharacterized protein n=1 Tax=Eutreptiella gymnastica TaxID=73025 RepID=A0A7S1IV44_9EUGL|mmetsp:Transcript_45196/g.80857  ORF Transcript_45196/g.80857 Transcript_45196/m.80857 type:complete len:102 (+) Transcript_45196:19-324(+)